MNDKTVSRREILQKLAASAATGAALGLHPWLLGCDRDRATADPVARSRQALEKKRRYLIVVGATGGASIIDSFMAIRHSEAGPGYEQLNCFPDSEVVSVTGSPFRAVNTTLTGLGPIPLFGQLAIEQESFVKKHTQHMMVSTLTGTSVNHAIAQQRAVNGGGVWSGRTLQEAVANEYGADQPLANVALTSGSGFALRGADDSLPDYASPVPVADPVLWAMGLHGSRGIANAPSADLVDLARTMRDETIDPESRFHYTFQKSPQLERWIDQRKRSRNFEERDLITALNMLPDGAAYPLSAYGLAESPDGAKVRQAFPNYDTNPVEAQAALAFLLVKNDVSSAVTLAPAFDLALGADIDLSQGIPEGVADIVYNLPLAFDFSHTGHRSTQAFMWMRTLGIIDKLIDLLASEPAPDGSGDSLWDRSLVMLATDFGRDKSRPGLVADWSTGHELNNAVLTLSPMVRGNALLGGVDPTTGYTYGFDPVTGAPDASRYMEEKEIYAGILHALDVDTSAVGLPDMPAMRKA